MKGPVRVAYDALVAAHELKPDEAQSRAVAALDRLASSATGGLFARLFGSGKDEPAGVYLWGGVGRGKSMLMDLAFEHIDTRPKRRVHFHEFMLETHSRLRKARESEEGDPIEPVAGFAVGDLLDARTERAADGTENRFGICHRHGADEVDVMGHGSSLPRVSTALRRSAA